MTQPHIELAPEDALGADVAAPAVVHVVLELAFIDEVLTLPTNTLQPAILIDLPKRTLRVVFSDAQMVVDGVVCRGVPDDVLGVEDAELLPLSDTLFEGLGVVQGGDQAVVVLRLRLEFINQFLWKLWRRPHRCRLSRRPITLIREGLFRSAAATITCKGRYEGLRGALGSGCKWSSLGVRCFQIIAIISLPPIAHTDPLLIILDGSG